MNKTLHIFEDNHFTVDHCSDVLIPEYLIIKPKTKVLYLPDLPEGHLLSLGVILAKLEKILYDILKPENIYILKFEEKHQFVHFHIFPRSKELLRCYLTENSSNDRNAPLIFDWSRKKYRSNSKKVTFDTSVNEIIKKIKESFN